jgi:predicted dehydrogenase
MQASESRAAAASGGASVGTASGGGNVYEAYTLQLEGFCRTIRNGAPNLCDATVAYHANQAILAACQSVREKSRLEIKADSTAPVT